MSEEICKYEGKNVLLVEGKDDCHAIIHLCRKYNISVDFRIDECGSKEKLVKNFGQLFNSQEKSDVLGVVIDADNDFHSTWESIKNKISKYKYKINKHPSKKGTIIAGIPGTPSYPKIGIWIMPNNSAKGMLEDFCLKYISQDSKDFTKKCVENAKKAGHTTFKDVHKSKAVIHTYLAWQDEPGGPFGISMTRCILNSDNEILQNFLDWLKNLFAS